MSEKSPSKPVQSGPGEREARRAAALRANLMRRKAQSRARDNGGEAGAASDDGPDPEA